MALDDQCKKDVGTVDYYWVAVSLWLYSQYCSFYYIRLIDVEFIYV